MHEDKKRWFSAVRRMKIVPVSHWLAGEVRQSFLGKYPVIPIHNWIDLSVFKPGSAQMTRTTRRKYGIPEGAFVLLGVSAGWNDRKHSQTANKLRDFRTLQDRLTGHDNIRLVLVGGVKDPDRLPTGAISIPYVDDVGDLAAIYSMADVYLHTSMEDTFGKVIAEAMACGTPAIVYNSTGCPEVVGNGCGHVVEGRNIDQIYQSILKVQRKGKAAYTQACADFCINHFDMKTNTQAYLDLYRKALDR
jgi:glycosyltransferase involved in cell wall biosynthesis